LTKDHTNGWLRHDFGVVESFECVAPTLRGATSARLVDRGGVKLAASERRLGSQTSREAG
jgi:hypothetical protein